MFTLINAADEEYELEQLDVVGPTLAICKEDGIVFNHQTCFTYQLLKPKLTSEQEAKELAESLLNKVVLICLNVNGMFEDYVDTWDEIAELDDEDWYLEGTVLEIREGQLKLETDKDESEWIPFKHFDTIEISDDSEDEPFEEYE